MGEPGLDGAKGAKGPDGLCEPINAPACNCDTHTLVVHSQTADVRHRSKSITLYSPFQEEL